MCNQKVRALAAGAVLARNSSPARASVTEHGHEATRTMQAVGEHEMHSDLVVSVPFLASVSDLVSIC